jgi:transketolase
MKKYIDRGKKDTRSGFGEGLLLAGKADPRVVALTADLKGSLKMDAFAAEFPDRYYECGIAEANMIGVASGMAITGLIPFAGSFAEFVTGRVYDQVRMEVCYGKTNVKLASSHAGITLGEDGATHQTMEDIALMRALPDMVVLNPCDWTQTKNATIAVARYNGPVYLRFGRPKVADFMPDEPFEIGKAYVLNEGKDVSIIATGHMVWEALKAAEVLEELGISYDMRIISAHREPDVFFEYAKGAEAAGMKVIIAGAGMAAHLPGMCAALFPLPVIGVPMHTTSLGGRDSLYSIVQMPSGIPVATVAIGGAKNAGILAAKMLAISDEALLQRLKDFSQRQLEEVQQKDAHLQEAGFRNY